MFRPHFEPARTLYDALVAEQEYRSVCESDEWIENERNAIHQAAIKWAEQNGVKPPSVEDLFRIETTSSGHVDYTSKYAYGVAELLTKKAVA